MYEAIDNTPPDSAVSKKKENFKSGEYVNAVTGSVKYIWLLLVKTFVKFVLVITPESIVPVPPPVHYG